MPDTQHGKKIEHCRVAVMWIDWYAYHVARFQGLNTAPSLAEQVVGLELVGGVGVHAGLKFREDLPTELAIETLMPESSWAKADKLHLSRRLWTRLSQLEPEVLLVPGYYTLPAIVAALWAKLHGSSSVLMTESTAHDHPRIAWKEWAKSLLLRTLFDWAVAGGEDHLNYLKQLGFPAERTVHFYDVVDNQMFAEGADVLRRSTAATFNLPDRFFVYVGRFAEEKNVLGLLRSWLIYRKERGSWPLVLVGDGPLGSALREAIVASGFEQDVYFPGLKTSRALFPFYAFAGCFILPSTREPWGLVVNEAMAAGLPILVSDRCGCASDLVRPSINGFLFDPADSAALTARMHQMSCLEETELRAMGQASRDIVREYSPNNFGLEIAKIADLRQPDRRHTAVPRFTAARYPGPSCDASQQYDTEGSVSYGSSLA